MIDYQIQTTASDGKYSPRECVKMAKENGLISVAITDHDTVDGVAEGLAAGKELGVEVIPGIEISCDEGANSIHMLGLGIDQANAKLLEKLRELYSWRENRAKAFVEKLKELGFAVEYEDVRKRAAGIVARPHIADAVMENPANKEKLEREGIKVKHDFFAHYIADGAKAYVKSTPFPAEEAISFIHQAGGIAIWSHPTIPMQDYKLIEDTLGKFISFGIDGIEVAGDFTEDDTEFLQGLATKYALIKSVGSDFHDTTVRADKPEDGAKRIGGYKTFGYSTDGIRESILAAIAKRQDGPASGPVSAPA